jgi:putative intracellular protease/amidase
MAPNILIVLSSHDKLGDTGKPTGWYLPEFAHPYWIFTAAGAEVTIASPKGGEAPLDPISVSMFEKDEEAQRFLREKKEMWKHTVKLSDLVGKSSQFDAIFYVGGHGRK